MQHWTPDFVFGLNAPAQDRLLSKLGGLPWGLPEKDWPNCKECGRPMHFLAQIKHEPPMIDLGDEKAVLHAFKCDFGSICSFYDTDMGCNAVFVRSEAELGTELIPYPIHRIGEEATEGEATTLLELRLTGWNPFNDVLTNEHIAVFHDYDAHFALDDATAFPNDFDHLRYTKAGPIPYWSGNGPSLRLKETETFFQLTGDYLLVKDAPPSTERRLADETACWVWNNQIMTPLCEPSDKPNETNVVWANFCSDGIGFFFREKRGDTTEYGLEILR